MHMPHLHQLIAESRLDEAVRELLARTEGTHRYPDALLLSARSAEYKKAKEAYLPLKRRQDNYGTTYKRTIEDNFQSLEAEGITPGMAEIRQWLAAE